MPHQVVCHQPQKLLVAIEKMVFKSADFTKVEDDTTQAPSVPVKAIELISLPYYKHTFFYNIYRMPLASKVNLQ